MAEEHAENVTITMSVSDFRELDRVLALALHVALRYPEFAEYAGPTLRAVNSTHRGLPDFMPYEVPEPLRTIDVTALFREVIVPDDGKPH